MFRRIILLALSVAALVALAGPAAAQAEGPLITNFLGEGAGEVTAKSSNTVSTTAAGNLQCATTTLNLTLAENESTTAKGSGTGAEIGNPFTGNHAATCSSSSGSTTEILSIAVSSLHLTRHGGVTTGAISFSYTYRLYSHAFSTTSPIAHCTWNGTATVTRTGESTIKSAGTLKGEGTSFCPTEGSISGTFTVFDENGEAAVIH